MRKILVFLYIFVFVLLGSVLAGCNEKEGYVPPKMPEVPNVNYEVKGYVYNEEGMPLQNIHVLIGYKEGDYIPAKEIDQIYTNSIGYFNMSFTDLLYGKLYIEFVDENGEYANAGDYYFVKYTSDKEYWYKGRARVSASITLKKHVVGTD